MDSETIKLIKQLESYIRNLDKMAKNHKISQPNLAEFLRRAVRGQREFLTTLKRANLVYADIAYYGTESKDNFYLRIGTDSDPFFVSVLNVQKGLTDDQIQKIKEFLDVEINKENIRISDIDFVKLINGIIKKMI